MVHILTLLFELLVLGLSRVEARGARQFFFGRVWVDLGVEHHSHSSAPFFQA
jgi:hypothetical protein